MEKFEYVVIGSGQGGTPLATALAQAGRKTALVERTHVGGTCVNEGCTPTKTMVAGARVAYLSRRGKDYGVLNEGLKIDMETVRRRKRAIVDSFRSGSEKRLENQENLTLIMGSARFTGTKTLEITAAGGSIREIEGQTIVIDTGTRPALPQIEGIEDLPYLDSTSIMELAEVPKHLLVIGGGYIGLEFGQMLRRYGSRVTVVHRGAQLLSREDEDIAAEVLKILEEDGIAVHLESRPIKVEKHGSDITLHIRKGDGIEKLTGSHLLVAAGRTPNTDALNLKAAGIETDSRGFIRVNEKLETSAEGIYAIGDVKGGPAFTHISYDDFRLLKNNLLEKGGATTESRLVPYTVFIDPQLGRVGLSEKEAKRKGINYKVASMPMSWVARALEVDESRGMMKVLVNPKSRQILGCAVLGIEGGEIMAMIQIAMMGNLPYTDLQEGVFAHPTLAESLNNLFARVD